MTVLRFLAANLVVLMTLVPVVIVVACLLFRTARGRRGDDERSPLPGRRDDTDRGGE